MNAEVRYYISVFMKRLPLFLLVSLAISSAAAAFAVILPTVYMAKGLLLVEDPQIPTDLASSTVRTDEREQLEIVQRRLMTRANLLDIARSYEVYEDIGLLSPDQIVNRMRSNTRFNTSGRREAATLLEVQFYARTPQISASVVNEYVTRVLAENANQRTSQAEDTLAFFQQEVERLEGELDLRNQEILRFQNENAEALPDTLAFRMNRQISLQQQLSRMARERAQLEEQRARLVELRASGQPPPGTQQRPMTATERQIRALEDQLTSALSVYSEESVQIQVLRTQLATLNDRAADEVDASGLTRGAAVSEALSLVDLQIAEVDAQLQFLEEDGQTIDEELVLLEDSIARTPNNSIALEALERDYANVQRLYDRAVDRMSTAITGERIEVMSKGQRISVIEQALPPSAPDSPNRSLIASAGVVAGVGAGLGLIVLLELLNKAIRRPVDLSASLGITPIATVPYIATPGERLRRRMVILAGLALVALGIPAMLYYVHYEVQPLDLILDRIVSQLLP